MTRRFRLKARRGLTLLEVLVAAAVMAVGIGLSLEAIGHCASVSAQVKDRNAALLYARSKLEEILKEPTIAIGSDQGKNTDDTSNYDWYANIDQSSDASLYIVRVRATNRQTQYSADVWALRRPDLNTTPDGSTINPDGTTTPADGTTTGTTTQPAAGGGA